MACAPKYGIHPAGEHLERIRYSPNYVDDIFKNQIDTPQLAEGNNLFSLLMSNILTKKIRTTPESPIPSVKTDLKSLDVRKDTIVWLGHSSFFLLLGGNRILVDPVLSDYAAPFSFLNKAFAGTSIYSVEDMPDIDYLLITHDHWDHLDHPTVTALEPRVRHVICGLGVGAHLIHWKYAAEKIHEGDWYDAIALQDDFTIHVMPARHFSGRFLVRNKTLWVAFVLQTPTQRIFISGDSGYAPHFADIGERFGGFDLAVLENGQYDSHWPYIHMLPEETVQAALDLRTEALLPAHSGKFTLARHPWDEPLIRLTEDSRDKPYRLLTPALGEPVFFEDVEQTFSAWWESLK